jgi:hypothetical protein
MQLKNLSLPCSGSGADCLRRMTSDARRDYEIPVTGTDVAHSPSSNRDNNRIGALKDAINHVKDSVPAL